MSFRENFRRLLNETVQSKPEHDRIVDELAARHLESYPEDQAGAKGLTDELRSVTPGFTQEHLDDEDGDTHLQDGDTHLHNAIADIFTNHPDLQHARDAVSSYASSDRDYLIHQAGEDHEAEDIYKENHYLERSLGLRIYGRGM